MNTAEHQGNVIPINPNIRFCHRLTNVGVLPKSYRRYPIFKNQKTIPELAAIAMCDHFIDQDLIAHLTPTEYVHKYRFVLRYKSDGIKEVLEKL